MKKKNSNLIVFQLININCHISEIFQNENFDHCILLTRRLECKYEKKPHLFIDLNFMSEALAAHSKIVIPINFQPFEEIKYHECLVFVINSLYERKITITGEGIPYKVN